MSGSRGEEKQAGGFACAVVIPTLNAAAHWKALHEGLKKQTLPLKHILILDSTSEDGTAERAAEAGYELITVARKDFNHGRTRQIAVDRLSDIDIVIFLTQDAVMVSPSTLERLVAPFAEASIGATYGRQLPRPDANPIEAHARLFNYPAESHVNDWEQRGERGFKTAFLSNTYSAYRRSALQEVGGFVDRTISSEDALAAGKMLKSGWKTAYVADAAVEHSHPYTIGEEFSRYFDIGVCHHRQAWLVENFGQAGSEGRRFVVSELKYLRGHGVHLIPASLLRSLAKYVGYQLGRLEDHMPTSLKRKLSMYKNFWDLRA